MEREFIELICHCFLMSSLIPQCVGAQNAHCGSQLQSASVLQRAKALLIKKSRFRKSWDYGALPQSLKMDKGQRT